MKYFAHYRNKRKRLYAAIQKMSFKPACYCSSQPLGFTLGLLMDSGPSLLSTFLPTAWLGSYHRTRLIESYAFHLQCMFLYCANYKRLTFPFSLPPASLLPPSSYSLWRRRRKGMWIQSKSRASHLLLWFTALLGWLRREEGREEGTGG